MQRVEGEAWRRAASSSGSPSCARRRASSGSEVVGRGDDAAGRRVGQRLQRDQRAHDRRRASRRRTVARGRDHSRQQRLGVRRAAARRVDAVAAAARGDGYQVSTNGTRSPAAHGEVAAVVQVLAPASGDRRAQRDSASGPATAAGRRSSRVAPRARSSRSRSG